MTKISASILIVLALFALVGAEQFQSISFDQGRLRLRSLASSSSLKSFTYTNYTNVTGVTVDLGAQYIKDAGIDSKTQTDMMIFLAGSTTGFSTSGNYFTKFQCTDNSCGADTKTWIQTIHPMYSTYGNPFTFNITIGTDASNWKLKSSALLCYSEYNRYIYYPGNPGTSSYINNATTYGFIGMGVDGDSINNFQGDHPLFSVYVNGSGSGQLIFGNDTTKYDSSRVSQAIISDANWTMTTQNISIGPNMTVTSSKTTKLLLDLNYPGLGLPGDYYSDIFNPMVKQYNLVYNTTGGNFYYPYVYKGELANLGSIVFGLSNGQNVTIPPEAFTKKLEDGYYSILIQSVTSVSTNVYTKGSSEWANFAILGWSVMSNFYTVFEKTTTGEPTITLHPTYTAATATTTTTTSNWKTILIIAVVVLVALVVLSVAAKKKNNLTKSDLGVELRAARV